MRTSRSSFPALRWISIIFILIAVALTIVQLISYSRIRGNFPAGMVIAGVPVGGLDRTQAAERLVQAYGVPVEVHYGDAVIQIRPGVVGFELDLESMLSAADLQRMNDPFWSAFWDYLWNRIPEPAEVPLRASLSEDRLRAFLKEEISPRYDRPPAASLPVAGSTQFSAGEEGTVLDVDRAVTLIRDALYSSNARVVNLSYNKVSPPRPSLQNLQILLQQIIDQAGFDGITELYLRDLETNQEVHFAYQNGEQLQTDIAFSGASTLKIPIMVSVFKALDEPLPTEAASLIEAMIDRSDNPPADTLMMNYINENTGPLLVTEDLGTLGLPNTFLAGYFYTGAPLLKRYTTPANSRTDIYTNPDVYDQTTPAELGMLLDDIYQCAETGGGSFPAAFPGKISQNECKAMVQYLSRNRIGVLIEAGLPEGTQLAHKHGWITDPVDGVIHTIGDAGIAYTPGGDFVLVIFMYHPDQLVFNPINVIYADLSRAIYNYFNTGD
ncbi:MAG TPA: serine hydrolase [Anaerolineaceae bacterium]